MREVEVNQTTISAHIEDTKRAGFYRLMSNDKIVYRASDGGAFEPTIADGADRFVHIASGSSIRTSVTQPPIYNDSGANVPDELLVDPVMPSVTNEVLHDMLVNVIDRLDQQDKRIDTIDRRSKETARTAKSALETAKEAESELAELDGAQASSLDSEANGETAPESFAL